MYHLLCGSGSPKRHQLRPQHKMNMEQWGGGSDMAYKWSKYIVIHVGELLWGYCLH